MFVLYEIRNIVTNKAYFGQVEPHRRPDRKRYRTVEDRWNEHRKKLRKGIHSNPYLQNSWNKHGENTFQFSVITEVKTRSLVDALEDDYIKHNECYNLRSGGQSFVMNEETIEKIRAASKKNWANQKYRDAVSQGLKNSWTDDRRHKTAKRFSKTFDWVLQSPDKVSYSGITNLRLFCRIHQLSKTCIYRLVSGKQIQHKGWTLKRVGGTNDI